MYMQISLSLFFFVFQRVTSQCESRGKLTCLIRKRR